MFLYCNTNSNNTSSSTNTTIINNNTAALKNTINFLSVPFISEHCVINTTPYTIVGGNLRLNTYPGIITFTFNEDIIFTNTSIVNYSGTNTVTLKNNLGANISVLNLNNGSITTNTICRILEFNLTQGDLVLIKFETPYFYTKYFFNNNIDFFKTYNAIPTGTKLISNLGPITIEFPEPTLIFGIKTTGNIIYYLNNIKVFEGNTEYPNPITKIELDTDIYEINYYLPNVNLHNGYKTEIIDFSNYPVNYINPRHFQFNSTGIVNNTFSGIITFNEPTVVTRIIATNPIIDGNTYYGTINHPIKITTINAADLAEIEFYAHLHAEQSHNYNTIDFTQYSVGEINIENNLYKIYSNDQLNNPAMVNLNGNIIYSANSNAKIPFAGSGTIIIDFKSETYVYSITTIGSATALINNRTYTINGEVFLNDFINGSELCTKIELLLIGTAVLNSLKINSYINSPDIQGILFTEKFETATYEFNSVIFNTNIIGIYGSPNNSFGGPGVGVGGSAGPGQNNIFLGNATQSDIIFNTNTYVTTIKFLNSNFNSVAIIDGISYNLPNYGANSVYTLNLNKKITSILLQNTAVYEITYYIKKLREVIGLPDNSNNSVNLQFFNNLSGTYQLNVLPLLTGGANSYITATKGNTANPGVIYIQSSAANTYETVYARWQPNQSLELYHNNIKISGTGDILFYVVF